ncbi:AMP-binding protein [Luteimonas sp. FXH3W]|uniref:Long-chain-fatty-acid--CoA ligase n=1 Tax=Aquilutibacter rugosus TaxID=3115820 RepID=A0ABU7V060_9GAMM
MTDSKPWLSSYPEGVPAEIDLNEFSSVNDVFDEAVRNYADRPAFHNMGTTLTYTELDQRVAQFAAFLECKLGLKKGDRIVLMMPNCLQYPIALFGALRAGLVVVNTNPLYTPRELKHQLQDSGAKAVVVLDNFGATVETVLKELKVPHIITSGLGDQLSGLKRPIVNFVVKRIKKMVPAYSIPGAIRFNDALAAGKAQNCSRPKVEHGDTAFLQYTGGTTGVAKGAVLTHRNMIANMQQASAWVGRNVEMGKEIIITALPLYHIFALTANSLVFMKFGGLNWMITNPRDMPGFIKELKKSNFTAITGVNTLFNGLLNTAGFSELDFSRLHISLGGGMAVQRAVAERWKKTTGCTLVEAYGLTETSPAAVINPVTLAEYNGAIGLPIPSTDARIIDEEGNEVPTGNPGELCIKGPQVMKEYWQRPEETAKVLSADGWLRTGDIARMDEAGYFYIVDRKKDMILVSGFNVYPNEIEGVMVAMPGILEAAAIGVPDEHSGEAVKLFVVRKDPSITEAQVKEYAHGSLTGYKRPRHVEFVTELPKTNVGKILHRELRERELAKQ